MEAAAALEHLGGIATRSLLVAACGRAAVDRALSAGTVVADARGRYSLPVTDDAVRRAHALSGVLCLTSAALHHGWEVKASPDKPHILLPKKRKVSSEARGTFHLHRGDLHPDEVDGSGIATAVELTLTQCLRRLPYDAALAVADSALRHGVTPATLRRVARTARGPGSPQIRKVVAAARLDVANPFESCLRAISHVDGWIVLRFAWEDVMFDPEYVHSVLVAVVALAVGRTEAVPFDVPAA